MLNNINPSSLIGNSEVKAKSIIVVVGFITTSSIAGVNAVSGYVGDLIISSVDFVRCAFVDHFGDVIILTVDCVHFAFAKLRRSKAEARIIIL